LKPDFHNFDERILHGCFQMLTDYVEIDQERLNYLIMDTDQDVKKYSDAAKEIISLYKWWKEIRSARKIIENHLEEAKKRRIKIPPQTVEIVEKSNKQQVFRHVDYHPDEFKDYDNLIKELVKEEESRIQEDEYVLIKLMKVRVYLSS